MAHTVRCLSKAVIAAVENVRDYETAYAYSPEAFRLVDFVELAEGYLSDGTHTCYCDSRTNPDFIATVVSGMSASDTATTYIDQPYFRVELWDIRLGHFLARSDYYSKTPVEAIRHIASNITGLPLSHTLVKPLMDSDYYEVYVSFSQKVS
jgi:hypothetical protein